MTASHRSPNLGQALQEAVTLQHQGRLREAEKIYTRVLKVVPDQFDAPDPGCVAQPRPIPDGQRCPGDLASNISRRLFFARVSNFIQTRTRDRLSFTNTGRFKSPDSRASEDLSHL